jgi:hypothetical protein
MIKSSKKSDPISSHKQKGTLMNTSRVTTSTLIIYLVFLLGLLFYTQASHADQQAKPPAPQTPTPVDISFNLRGIQDISTKTPQFSIQYALHYHWHDPRLKASDAGRYIKAAAMNKQETIWTPELSFLDQAKPAQIQYHDLQISKDGIVTVNEIGFVTLSTKFQLHDFPFDTQRLPILIQPAVQSSRHIVLRTSKQQINLGRNIDFHSWKFRGLSHQINMQKSQFNNTTHSQLSIIITVKRSSLYYITKLYVPLLSFILVTCAVFCYPESEFSLKIPVLFSCLVLIALFSLQAFSEMPHLTYLTRLDKLVATSRLWLLVVFIFSLYLYLQRIVHDKETPKKFGRKQLCLRLMFPISYLMIWLYAVISGCLL